MKNNIIAIIKILHNLQSINVKTCLKLTYQNNNKYICLRDEQLLIRCLNCPLYKPKNYLLDRVWLTRL